jgi:hypothetical protein
MIARYFSKKEKRKKGRDHSDAISILLDIVQGHSDVRPLLLDSKGHGQSDVIPILLDSKCQGQ